MGRCGGRRGAHAGREEHRFVGARRYREDVLCERAGAAPDLPHLRGGENARGCRRPAYQGATKCTLAALQSCYVSLGAIEVPSVVICDEISLCTTQDFHTLLELRKLGCALWLIGDPASQLTAIGDNWHSADLTGDISETAMLRSAVDCQRCVFTEPRRCDARLSSLPPLPEAIALARQAFPRRGRPQEWNLCLCHLTRRRVIARAQKERLRRERPTHYLSLDGEAPLGQRTLHWPGTRHIACMAQSKQGMHNSMLSLIHI